jgi:diguanylate cyclase (GGDEF)-like protein/PAS domain S-box-containing protein
MSEVATEAGAMPRPSLFGRLHRALLFDYNRKAATYWWTMVLLGGSTLPYALWQLAGLPATGVLQVVAGVAIAMLAGSFPVQIPRTKNSFVAGEIFIFLLLLMHGPAAAALAAAGEAFVGSCRSSKRWSSRLGSPAMAALAMFLTGTLFQAAFGAAQAIGLGHPAVEVTLLLAAALGYAYCSSLFVTTAFALKRGEPIALRNWFTEYGWFGLTYFANASLAALLHMTFEQFGLGVLVAAVPVLAMFLATVHYFLAQQAAAERERLARTEAAEREADQAARHVRELERSESRFHSAFSHASIGMALVTIEGRVLQVNRALCVLLGYDERELVGIEFRDLLDVDDATELNRQLGQLAAQQIDNLVIEARCRHREGRDVWISLHSGLFDDASSSETCLIVQVQDITGRRQAEAQLQQIAFHDSLTGLVNRIQFNVALQRAIDRARSGAPGGQFAVMFLDFDRFKLINDSLGHSVGDRFLIEVAQRIRGVVRPIDIVARLGGDEFAVLMLDVEREAAAITLAERLQSAVRKPILIDGTEIATSASIGITFSHFGYSATEEVLRDADTAMYKAKSLGRARHAVFDAGLHAKVSDRLALENDLRRAVENRQLAVVYQPLFRLDDNALIGFEALLRWQHPVRGQVSPATFIPIAEESGLIGPITDWVLDQACAQLRAAQLHHPSLRRLRMHVNISGHDLQQRTLAARVAQALENSGLQPHDLTLEITEGMLMERIDLALETLERLHQLGVGLSVDDFGTGYSSLSYLSSMPISSLKIDSSFVRRLQGDGKDSEIVRAVIQLGAALGKSVIAEGIETHGQAQRLRELGCQMGQGFHLSRPLTPEQLGALLDWQLAETQVVPEARPLAAVPAYLH